MRNNRRSFRLDASKFDYLGPFLSFSNDEFAEIGRRPRHRRATQVNKARFNFRVGETSIDRFIQPIDNITGRILGDSNAVPSTCLIAWQKLAQRRNLRQLFGTNRGRYGKWTKSTSPQVFKGCWQVVEHPLN